MLFVKAVLLLAVLGYSSACSCRLTPARFQLQGDPVYEICHHAYLTRIRLSRPPSDTCDRHRIGDPGCYLKAEVIEDFFAPLNERDRPAPVFRKLISEGHTCSVPLPAPGDYIMNAEPNGDTFQEIDCFLFREPYTDKRAAEIRETVKRCPRERRNAYYWEAKGLELQLAKLQTSTRDAK